MPAREDGRLISGIDTILKRMFHHCMYMFYPEMQLHAPINSKAGTSPYRAIQFQITDAGPLCLKNLTAAGRWSGRMANIP
jgi:hypothetical protein